MKILVHFGSQLKKIKTDQFLKMIKNPHEYNEKGSDDSNASTGFITRNVPNIIYVMKWIRTRHAIMFRLSNNMIQSIFDDGSEVMFNNITK